jgi:hypothetical protein
VKSSGNAPSATSLPRAPRDEVGARSARYLAMMGIRVACFILMVVITPYGWYTWVFAAGAIFLPYIAVVIANVGSPTRQTEVLRPGAIVRVEPARPESAGTADPTTPPTASSPSDDERGAA